MKFDFPFHYAFHYVIPPKIKHQTSYAAASVELEIRELTESQAPVAMKVGNPRTRAGKSTDFEAKADDSLREVRIVDGKYYVEDDTLADLVEKLKDPGEIEKTIFGKAKPLQFREEWRGGAMHRVLPLELIRPTTLDAIARSNPLREHKNQDDKGAAMIAKLKMIAEDTLVVDGRLFIRCREPVLSMDRFANALKIVPSPAKVKDLDRRPYEYTHQISHWPGPGIASLKTADALYAYLKKSGRTSECPRFEVVDPSWSRFDGTGYSISHDLNELQTTLQTHMSTLPRDLLEAYFILRESNLETDGDKFTVSPAILQAVSLIASSKLPSVEADQSAAMFELWRFARKEQRDWGSDVTSATVGQSRSKIKDNLTFNLVENRETIQGFVKRAKVILKRWEARSSLDHFATQASWDMLLAYEGAIVREVNSEGPLYAACVALDVDPEPLIARAREGHRVLTISGTDNDIVAAVTVDHAHTSIFGAMIPADEVRAAVAHYIENEKDYVTESGMNLDLTARRI